MGGSPLRVLLVEDMEDDADLVCRELSRSGYAVKADRVDSREALARSLDGGAFDLVVSDYTLPGFNGLDALAAVRARLPATPFIFVSGTIGEERAIEALKRGATDYILKDRLSRLGQAVRRALEEERRRRDLSASEEVIRRYASQLERMNAELMAANARLEEMSLADPLTGLRNRRGLQRVLTGLSRLAERTGESFLALLLDMDDFKRVNDGLGYVAGDAVLRATAERLASCLRKSDFAARVGGDEFLLLLPHTRMAEGLQLAERVRVAVCGEPVPLRTGPVRVSASIGLIEAAPSASTIEEILALSHLALRQSKGHGKNRVTGYGEGKGSPVRDSLPEVLRDLGRPDAFFALRHPIIRLSDGRLAGYEMLGRTRIESFEDPEVFLRLGYEASILSMIDRRCFEVCLAAAERAGGSLRFHVNVLPSTLSGLASEPWLGSIPEGLRRRLCVELSEQRIVGDPSQLVAPLGQLRAAGIRLSIEDVGFGRSSLESLVVLEPDFVKVDRRWVHGIGAGDPGCAQPLRRLVAVVRALGSETIAEGIETPEDLRSMRDLGIDFGQGFLWGRPS